ncbi:hypothetical protein [Treponema sp. R6D11]
MDDDKKPSGKKFMRTIYKNINKLPEREKKYIQAMHREGYSDRDIYLLCEASFPIVKEITSKMRPPKHRPENWTRVFPDEKVSSIKNLYQSGTTVPKIAYIENTSEYYIRKILKDFKCEPSPTYFAELSQESIEDVKKRYSNGEKVNIIMKNTGISIYRIHQIIKNLPAPTKPSYWAKLGEERVNTVIRLHQNKHSVNSIKELTGITTHYINKIIADIPPNHTPPIKK